VRALVLSSLVLVACGPKPPANEEPKACRVTLPPRAVMPSDLVTPTSFAAPRSTIVVHAEIPLRAIQQNLEAKLARRVAEERDHDLGVAGRLEYTVDRGPLAVSVAGDRLLVATPLTGHARACAKGSCYAGCDPILKATAAVPLALGPDYKFRHASVTIDVVRGCEVRALGGLLTVDVTPVLRDRLAGESKKIEAQIDRELPDLRPEAERLWAELGKPRALPLGACVVVAPEGIVQGPPAAANDAARLRFGLLARPELRVRCGEPPATRPLPPLADDPSLAPEGDIHLAIALGKEGAGIALEGADVDLGSAKAKIGKATGPATALGLTLGGETCGDVAVRASGASWKDDGRALLLGGVVPMGGESERLAGAGVDAAALARSIERAPIAVPIAPADLATVLPALASSLSDDRVTATTTVSEAKPESAGLRGNELVGVAHVRASITLRTK
jgi:hypothetical protein